MLQQRFQLGRAIAVEVQALADLAWYPAIGGAVGLK